MKPYKIKGGISFVKPRTREDLDYDLTKLEEDWFYYKDHFINKIKTLEWDVKELQKEPILNIIKRKIKNWLEPIE